MNYLKYDPAIIKNDYLKREYTYSFLDHLSEYFDIIPIYHYLLSIDQFKLKNIWNYFIKKWKHMHQNMDNNKKYKRSVYSNTNKTIIYIHQLMQDGDLDRSFSIFIDNNICRSIFVVNCILSNI